MDELEISGKRYISAKLAAKEHKYHSDYIGQLVRGKKVTGQKVGRAWYVEADSLAEYLGKEVSSYSPKSKSDTTDSEDTPLTGIVGSATDLSTEPLQDLGEGENVESAETLLAEQEASFEEAESEVRDVSVDLPADESTPVEPEFVMPFRKSARHHVIAAMDEKIESTEKEVEEIAEEKNKEVVIEKEEPFVRTFNAYDSEVEKEDSSEEETVIPVKIEQTQKQSEPEDSFYKVSRKSLRYVSAITAAAQSDIKKNTSATVTVDEVKETSFTDNRTQRIQNKFALSFMAIAGVVVVTGILSLSAGVFASYYLQSETTIMGQGQTSSIILSK